MQRADGAPTWLLRELGRGFTLLVAEGADDMERLAHASDPSVPLRVLVLRGPDAPVGPGLRDTQGLAARRYDLRPGTAYLLRPDQHVCARWRHPTPHQVRAAIRRALAHDEADPSLLHSPWT